MGIFWAIISYHEYILSFSMKTAKVKSYLDRSQWKDEVNLLPHSWSNARQYKTMVFKMDQFLYLFERKALKTKNPCQQQIYNHQIFEINLHLQVTHWFQLHLQVTHFQNTKLYERYKYEINLVSITEHISLHQHEIYAYYFHYLFRSCKIFYLIFNMICEISQSLLLFQTIKL